MREVTPRSGGPLRRGKQVIGKPLLPQKESHMKFVGVDLHKKTISLCVVVKARGKIKVLGRKRFCCRPTEPIARYFKSLEKFQMTVESTIGYEWFVHLIEAIDDCRRVVVAHPSKMRVIAESTCKTDKIDAQILAEFLARDMIPAAWMPTPRVRQHRSLVRHRYRTQVRITQMKNRCRGMLARYNEDRASLFTKDGWTEAMSLPLLESEKWILCEMGAEIRTQAKFLKHADAQLVEFAETATAIEREQRELLATMPGVGVVTIDVVLCELGDVRRFTNSKQIVSYAGLDPGVRESDRKRKDLGISRAGSKMLRWAMIQLAWRVVRQSARWRYRYDQLKQRRGAKKAITAIARRQLTIIAAILRTGECYNVHDSAKSATRKAA
ncbi:IS110 family RNA-guided transposase [Aporhodopirellula aestuarii]|nr:IS110 family transposase [Aporhodopirellula aestuarii]